MRRFISERAWCIPGVSRKTICESRAGFDTGDAITSGLRFGRDDCNFFPEQIIQQRRLADIGPADDRDVA